MTDSLLRRPEVEQRTGLSRSTIYDWMKRGDFPQPVKLGARIVAWRESDVMFWLDSREERGANMNPIEKIFRVTKPEAKIDAIVGTPSPPSVKDQKTREDYHLFSSYAGGRHGRATRILGYCLNLNAPDTWLGATAIWKKCLTMAEIVGLAYSVMSGLPREIAVIVTESALCQRRTKNAPYAVEKVHHLAGSGRSKSAPPFGM
jgi:prophage regulatory protein